jgi:predicted acetyltransferase
VREIRPIRLEELEEYIRLDAYAFGYSVADALPEPEAARYRTSHRLAAFVDGRMVAHLALLRWGMALNGGTVPIAGIADVATWPEDRRGGHAAALLRACLARMRDEGVAAAMLYPTFAALYRRFGWATAAETRRYTLRAADVRLEPAPPPHGRARRLPPDRLPIAAGVYARALPAMNGALVRDDALWDRRRHAAPPPELVIWEDGAGLAQGYVLHRYPRRNDIRAGYGQRLDVEELVAITPDAYRGLVTYLLRHDLADPLTWTTAPDDPLRALLADPDAVRVTTEPAFMLRVVDVARALTMRPYLPGPPARLALRVTDVEAPWNGGVWLLVVEEGRAQVTRADVAPALATDIGTLSALYNGYLTPAAAWTAGLIDAADAEALAVAARLFAVTRPPHCLDRF